MQKARRHPILIRLRPLVSAWFQVYFTSLFTMLFTFPSRYSSSIGLPLVFSLARWSWLLPARFLVSRSTQAHTSIYSIFRVRGFHPLRPNFPVSSTIYPISYPFRDQCGLLPHICLNLYGLGSYPFARHYLGNHYCFLFLWLLRWFSSPGSLYSSSLQCYVSLHNGLPHSDISRSPVARHLPEAFRSLPRPSSPVETKASPMHSYILPLFTVFFFYFLPLSLPTYFFLLCFIFFFLLLSLFGFSFPPQYVNLLSFFKKAMENIGFEPMTPSLQSWCSSQLS